MKLSSRTRLAINAMVELSTRDAENQTPIIHMAEAYGMSQSSMEQLFSRLRRAGLVNGRRGRRGGYTLARPADEIPLANIVAAVDDYRPKNNGVKGTSDEPKQRAIMAWDCLSQNLYAHLEKITLAALIESARHAETHGRRPRGRGGKDPGKRQKSNAP